MHKHYGIEKGAGAFTNLLSIAENGMVWRNISDASPPFVTNKTHAEQLAKEYGGVVFELGRVVKKYPYDGQKVFVITKKGQPLAGVFYINRLLGVWSLKCNFFDDDDFEFDWNDIHSWIPAVIID